MFTNFTKFYKFSKIHIFSNKYTQINSVGKRFISDADILKSIKKAPEIFIPVRESRYDSRIKNVLVLLHDNKYDQVVKIISKDKINIDAHDFWENTPLTDAAKRGDTKTVEFLVKNLKANPHASCDCPYHKTALHYACENGHYETVKMLLELGAKPNVLDSREYTALDVAKNNNIRQLLLEKNGICGDEIAKSNVQKLNLPKANCPSKLI